VLVAEHELDKPLLHGAGFRLEMEVPIALQAGDVQPDIPTAIRCDPRLTTSIRFE
jgi:hypothetical protein